MSKKAPIIYSILPTLLNNFRIRFTLIEQAILLIEHFHNDYKTMGSIRNRKSIKFCSIVRSGEVLYMLFSLIKLFTNNLFPHIFYIKYNAKRKQHFISDLIFKAFFITEFVMFICNK